MTMPSDPAINTAASPPATARGITSPRKPRIATRTPSSKTARITTTRTLGRNATASSVGRSVMTFGITNASDPHATSPTPAHPISFEGARSVKNQWIAAKLPSPTSANGAAEAFMNR